MFPYFTDPVNFAYLRDDATPCEFCGATSHRLDGAHLYGVNEIDAVCFSCLERGALIERDISTNSVNLESVNQALGDTDAAESLTKIIEYRTPKLPTWQDCFWPFIDGDFATFIKIASKTDFDDKRQFVDSVLPDDIGDTDTEWLWESLPDHPIATIKEGQYDVSVYLFHCANRIVTIWDAN